MDPRLIGAFVAAILFDVAMPIALGVYVRRRLGVSWRYFWYGALIFFLFQMITRVPAVQILQLLLAEPLRRSAELQWAWLFALALTAGIFEEVGRYLGYRYLVFRRTPTPQHSAPSTQHSEWRKGVMYGLGHGGLESMLLVGGLATLSLVNALVILRMDPNNPGLPPDQLEAFRQARVVLEGMAWWFPLLGAFERLCTVVVQVGFSILVLQVFLQGSMKWLYLAIAGHFAVDFIVVGASRWLGPVGTEGVIALVALGALYLVFRLKPAPG